MGEIITLKEAHNYMVNILNMDMGEATDVMLDERLKILSEQVCGKVCINTNNLEEVIKTKRDG
jgi:hypothetical protein